MNFDKNCSLSTQVYVNYISCPNNFKICCHPNPSYNSLIISTLLLKNYEDLIPPHFLFIHTIICIYVGQHWMIFVYTWDSTGSKTTGKCLFNLLSTDWNTSMTAWVFYNTLTCKISFADWTDIYALLSLAGGL